VYYNIMYITHWPKEAEYTVVSATVYLPTHFNKHGEVVQDGDTLNS